MGFKFNPFTGTLDLTGSGSASENIENFSYTNIDTGSTVTVPESQQMFVAGDITVDGTLTVDGAIAQEVDYSLWSFGWNTIPDAVTLRVKSSRDFLFVSPITIDGVLAIDGRAIEVA